MHGGGGGEHGSQGGWASARGEWAGQGHSPGRVLAERESQEEDDGRLTPTAPSNLRPAGTVAKLLPESRFRWSLISSDGSLPCGAGGRWIVPGSRALLVRPCVRNTRPGGIRGTVTAVVVKKMVTWAAGAMVVPRGGKGGECGRQGNEAITCDTGMILVVVCIGTVPPSSHPHRSMTRRTALYQARCQYQRSLSPPPPTMRDVLADSTVPPALSIGYGSPRSVSTVLRPAALEPVSSPGRRGGEA